MFSVLNIDGEQSELLTFDSRHGLVKFLHDLCVKKPNDADSRIPSENEITINKKGVN